MFPHELTYQPMRICPVVLCHFRGKISITTSREWEREIFQPPRFCRNSRPPFVVRREFMILPFPVRVIFHIMYASLGKATNILGARRRHRARACQSSCPMPTQPIQNKCVRINVSYLWIGQITFISLCSNIYMHTYIYISVSIQICRYGFNIYCWYVYPIYSGRAYRNRQKFTPKTRHMDGSF